MRGYTPNIGIGKKNYHGFTLIELLVGLTIVAVLFGLGYASFRDFSRRQALASAGKQVQGDLRLIQQEALSGQKNDDPLCNGINTLNGYRFGVTDPSGYRLRADCTGGASTDFKIVTLPSGITISTPNPNPIIFKVLGNGTNIPSGQNATLVLTQANTGKTFTITISAVGEIH